MMMTIQLFKNDFEYSVVETSGWSIFFSLANKSRILFLLTKNEKKNSWNLKLTNCNNKSMKGQYWKKIWFFVKNKQNKTKSHDEKTDNKFFEPNFVFEIQHHFISVNEWMNNDYDDYLYLNGPITGPMNEWMNECIS